MIAITNRPKKVEHKLAATLKRLSQHFGISEWNDPDRLRRLREDLRRHRHHHKLGVAVIQLRRLDQLLGELVWQADGTPRGTLSRRLAAGEMPRFDSPPTQMQVVVKVRRGEWNASRQSLHGRWIPWQPAARRVTPTPPTPPQAPPTAPPHPVDRARRPAPRPVAAGDSQLGGRIPLQAPPTGGERVRLTVTDTGRRGYAFGNVDDGPQKVFLHVHHAPSGFVFQRGAVVTARLVETPDGVQGREIRPAAGTGG